MRRLLDPRIRAHLAERVDRELATVHWRFAIAVALAALHLFAFAAAGRDRLDLPFNSAPGEAPYYSDPDAPALGGYPRQPHHWSRLIVSRYDAQHYIGFALRGLTSCPDAPSDDVLRTDNAYMQCGLGWFPAYGMIAGAIAAPFDWPVDVVLVVLSVLAAIAVNLMWTSKTIVDRLGRAGAYAALVAFNLYPSAFYLVAPYTESWTLALALGGFLCLANERWILAGLLVGASTGLRGSAIALGVAFGATALVVAVWRRRAHDPRWWRPFVAAPLAGWGLIAQAIALQIAVGDWRAFLRAREAFGDKHDYGRLWDPVFYLKGFTAQHMDSVMLLGATAIVALTARELWRRLRPVELVFLVAASGLGVALAITTVHEYSGLNRYLLLCPILFLALGVVARRHTALFVGWLIVSALVYWHIELCSYVAQGSPDICPCLGRIEWWAPFAS